MAVNKMYITQDNEYGQILISEDVIATVAYQALADIEGYAGLSSSARGEFIRPLSEKHWRRGIHVFVNEKGMLFIELDVLVYYAADITSVAQNIQNKITEAVYSVTGQHPRRIHVNICGVIHK